MIRCGKKSKILAAVLAAGIILSMQGMTAFAGSTGAVSYTHLGHEAACVQ